MKKIIGIGNALVDVLAFTHDEKILDHFSLPKGSMQLVDGAMSAKILKETEHLQRSMASGGSAANTIHGLAMLGADTGFIGAVGKDENGAFFENELKSAGVRTFLKKQNTPTGTAAAFVTPDSERTFATYLGAALELDPADLHPDLFSGYDLLYLEGYLIYSPGFVAEACSIARSLNMKVALDLASYNVVEENLRSFKEIVEKYTDILFANSAEAKAYTGEEPEEALRILSEHCEIAVVKTGPLGSLVKSRKESLKIPAFPVECNDTTGAGDLYASGFLYGLALGKPLKKCGLYGSYLAAKVIEIPGARIGTEKWPEIRKTVSVL